jgi:DNA-binding NarL/FixJ family response regulator
MGHCGGGQEGTAGEGALFLQRAKGAGPVRVLVAGEEGHLREGVAAALAASPGIEVAGEARDGEEAVTKARELEPDLVVIDLPLFRELAEQEGATGPGAPGGLTQRELEVLSLVAQSKTNKDIAASLFISENTVKNHIRNILEKLHLHSRMEAVTYAWRHRMLEPRDHRP